MRAHLFSFFVLAILSLKASAAALEPRGDVTKAQTLRYEDVVRFTQTDTEYGSGSKDKIAKIEKAVETCRTQLMKSIEALNAEKNYLDAQKALAGSNAPCAKFMKEVLKAPIGAVLHVHFNAILPFDDAWKIFTTKNSIDDFSAQQIKSLNDKNVIQVGGQKLLKELKPDDKIMPIEEKEIGDFRAQILLLPDFNEKISQWGRKMWDQFNAEGTPVWKLPFLYEKVLEDYTRQVILTGLEQNIYYQEWRTMFFDHRSVIKADGGLYGEQVKGAAIPAAAKIYLDIVSKVIDEEKDKKGSRFKGAKIIYCIPRVFNNARAQELIDVMIALRKDKKYRKLIAGFDIVGEEDKPGTTPIFRPTEFYKNEIDKVIEEATTDTSEYPRKDYPFGIALHAGESHTADKNALSNVKYLGELARTNAAKNVQFRGGHTVVLSILPESDQGLVSTYRKYNIHSELCPISNNVLGSVENAGAWENIYTPIISKNSASLNGDDPTYQQSVPSDELLYGWRGGMTFVQMIAVGEMAINSGFLTVAERADLLKLFREDWTKFIADLKLPSG